jgi:tripartite-type tricarboxylate transporter receptor subunit TctC
MDRRQIIAWMAATAAAQLANPAWAQSAVGKQARFIVGFPAGGVVDFAIRTTADALSANGQPLSIIENRAGASGNIALEFVARQSPESHQFAVLSNSVLTTNPFVPQLSSKAVDPFKDLVPVAAIADMVLLLAVTPQLGVTTLEQFLAKAREPGQRLRVGLAGTGTPHHLSALLLERSANLDLTMVPYKGGPPMIADAAGGHLDAVFTTIPVGGPMVASGKLRWIAVVQPNTLKNLPGVPSLVDVFKGQSIPSWVAVWAPASMAPETLDAMNALLNTAINSPATAAKLRNNGLEPLNLSRAEMNRRLNDEAKFMKDFLGKIKLDFQT